jgi:signal transduction histidine kinase
MTLFAHSEELSEAHTIEVNVHPESLLLQADPGQLRQVFWNLARNAVAAMPGGGILRVMSELEGQTWRAVISDTGRGMTPEERDRLFTPFAHSFPGGTGLGLAIVYRIISEHGGSIRVDTALEKGTSISLSFPVISERIGKVSEISSRPVVTGLEREVA